jgi:transcriptional regulator with XRE-family HTH domain
MSLSGKQLRAALERLNITQTEAAKRLGVTARTVRRWVAGDTRIPEAVAIVVRSWHK